MAINIDALVVDDYVLLKKKQLNAKDIDVDAYLSGHGRGDAVAESDFGTHGLINCSWNEDK